MLILFLHFNEFASTWGRLKLATSVNKLQTNIFGQHNTNFVYILKLETIIFSWTCDVMCYKLKGTFGSIFLK